MSEVKHILLAENEVATRQLLASRITQGGYELTEVEDGDKALETLIGLAGSSHPVHLLIADISMVGPSGRSGLDLIQEIHKRGIYIPVLAISKHGSENIILALTPREPFGFEVKPYEPRNVLESITEAFHKPVSN